MDAYLAIREKQIPLHAAYAGYFIILSVFPALLMLLSILRFTGIQVETLVALIDAFLPHALTDTVEELVYSTWANSTGTVLGLSALTALWSASRGVFGLLRGLNAVYDVWEDRGYFYTRGISVVYTFLFGLVLLLTLFLHVFGSTLLNWLSMVDNGIVIFLMDLIDLFPPADSAKPDFHPDVYGFAQSAKPLCGQSARRHPGLHRLAGVFRSFLHLCGKLQQLFQHFWVHLRGGAGNAVAVLLPEHPVLWRRAESLPESAVIL